MTIASVDPETINLLGRVDIYSICCLICCRGICGSLSKPASLETLVKTCWCELSFLILVVVVVTALVRVKVIVIIVGFGSVVLRGVVMVIALDREVALIKAIRRVIVIVIITIVKPVVVGAKRSLLDIFDPLRIIVNRIRVDKIRDRSRTVR